jgi:phage tail sheath protein FI
MIQVTSPGVYIEELPSGVHTITGVATSITAFVGYTSRGIDNRAELILSFADFERQFGGLAADSELSYAVQQFFNNGGSQAYVVRVPRHSSSDANITLLDAVSAGNQALALTALSAGSLANGLLIDIDYDGIASSDSKSYNITITDPSTGTVESFLVTQDSTKSNYVVSIINDPDNGSQFVSAAVPNSSAGRPVQNGSPGGDIASSLPLSGPLVLTVTCDVPTTGTTINALSVNAMNTGDSAGSILGLAGLVQRNLNLALANQLAGAAATCVPSADGLGLRIIGNFNQSLLPGTADVVITFGGAGAATLSLPTSGTNVAHYVLGTGRNTAAQMINTTTSPGSDGDGLPQTGALIGDSGAIPPTGIYALEKVDLFNLLCIPDATRATAGNPNALDTTVDPNSIFGAALTYCQSRRAFLLVDPPPNVNTVDAANDWVSNTLSNLSQSYGAAYFPRIRLADPLNNYQLRTFGPCGVIAGLFARIDGTRGVWKAPAGTEATLTQVQSMVYKLTDAENGVLNPLGLNCLRTFPVYGNISWGARTLRGADVLADDYKYVPVRRLALYIEESLYRGTKWAVFEGNDDPLWAQLRLNIGAFMNTLFRQGAFAGTTAKSAYFVKCDSETTTQNDINQGIVNILVGFAPLKPAEFVVIQIQQMAGQIQT